MTLDTVAPARVIRFSVNETPTEVTAPGARRLLDVLREDLELTGTKEGCGEGECGACSVLLDGQLVNSCLVPMCQVEGREVRTVEGLTEGPRLGGLQSAFVATGAVQCGFCAPGMLLAGQALLDSGVPVTEPAVREAIAGNLCRCTGYTKIIEAIELEALAPSPEGALQWPDTAPTHLPQWLPGALPAIEPPPGRVALPAFSSVIRTSRRALHEASALSPRTLDEALRLLADHPFRPIAGGTDVMVAIAAGAAEAEQPLLDLWSLDELRGIRVEPRAGTPERPDALALGSLTTFAEIRRSPLVVERLPVLAEVAASVGAAQIQNRGTLGGNIANASPAGDLLPVLLATDAVIVLCSIDGERRVPAAAFFTGYRSTARVPEELILRVEIPLPPGRRVRFRKVGTRRALAISKVVLAVSWRDDDPGHGARSGDAPDHPVWRDVRVAIGSVAPVPMRARETEGILDGAAPTRRTADRAAAAVAAEIVPIDDVRSTAAYRRTVTGRILRRIIRDVGGW